MSKTPQDKSVQETTATPEQRPHPYYFNGKRFYDINDDDFIGACQMGSAFATELLGFMKRNPDQGCLIESMATIGRPEIHNAEKPNKTLGFQVGFLSAIEGVLIDVARTAALCGGFEKSESSLDYYGRWVKHLNKTHDTIKRLKAEEKQGRSERARKAAMVRWHGKDSQAVKSL